MLLFLLSFISLKFLVNFMAILFISFISLCFALKLLNFFLRNSSLIPDASRILLYCFTSLHLQGLAELVSLSYIHSVSLQILQSYFLVSIVEEFAFIEFNISTAVF